MCFEASETIFLAMKNYDSMCLKNNPMQNTLKDIFPNFSSELILTIEENGSAQDFEAGTILMRTGQYIKNTVLITKEKSKFTVKAKTVASF
jgi:hypothetical protein